MMVIGYDPGGKKKNGVALLEANTKGLVEICAAVTDDVDGALAWLDRRLGRRPVKGAGIDTLLSWSTGPSGWRPMDKDLWLKYPKARKSILSSNSLYGAMGIQGMAMALKLRKKYGNLLQLNETHPKVLYHELNPKWKSYGDLDERNDWLKRKLSIKPFVPAKTDDEWDAMISAWITWRGIRGGANDLMEGRSELLFPAGRPTYFWPKRKDGKPVQTGGT